MFEILDNFFILTEGSLAVSIVAPSHVELPFESELVSALWLITVGRGAKVIMGTHHCMKLSVAQMSHIAMVTAKVNKRVWKPLRLLYNEEASFSCENLYGTVKLPVLNEETSYLVGIVTHPDPGLQPTGILSWFRSRKLICQYRYLVVYELCRQYRSVSYNHWRVHVLSFKNISGFAVSLMLPWVSGS